MQNEFRDLRAANLARQAEWDGDNQTKTPLYRTNELSGELGESIEAVLDLLGYTAALASAGARISNTIKKLERERMGIRGSRSMVDALADELADLEICADLLAIVCGIDRRAAVVRKFNATSEKVGLKTRLLP